MDGELDHLPESAFNLKGTNWKKQLSRRENACRSLNSKNSGQF